MQEVKVVELLPNGLTKVELPKSAGLAAFKMALLEMVCTTPEERQAMYSRVKEVCPGLLEYRSDQPSGDT